MSKVEIYKELVAQARGDVISIFLWAVQTHYRPIDIPDGWSMTKSGYYVSDGGHFPYVNFALTFKNLGL